MPAAKTSLSTDRDLYAGLIRLHVLHHASERPVYGAWIIEELGHHGYALSPGTLYPLLHGLEKKGYLRSRMIRTGRRTRRLYAITPRGRAAFARAREKVRELFGELFARHHQ
ncbi:MAG TPA: PadR family transcriptional regulator [Rhizomicrobium sp.]|nr:PadR family transcriptional regulator [Rhizomicrobium sp.]